MFPNPLIKSKGVSHIDVPYVDELEDAYDDLEKSEKNLETLYGNLAKRQQKLAVETFDTAESVNRNGSGRYEFKDYSGENKKKLMEIRDRWVNFFYDLKQVKVMNSSNKYVVAINDDVNLTGAIKVMGDLFPNENNHKTGNYYFDWSLPGGSREANAGFKLKEPIDYESGGYWNTKVTKGTWRIISPQLYPKYGIDEATDLKKIEEIGGRATMKQRRKKKSGKVRSKKKTRKTNRKYHRLRK